MSGSKNQVVQMRQIFKEMPRNCPGAIHGFIMFKLLVVLLSVACEATLESPPPLPSSDLSDFHRFGPNDFRRMIRALNFGSRAFHNKNLSTPDFLSSDQDSDTETWKHTHGSGVPIEQQIPSIIAVIPDLFTNEQLSKSKPGADFKEEDMNEDHGFRLEKRAVGSDLRPAMGLGKRPNQMYSFGLGKRMEKSSGKQGFDNLPIGMGFEPSHNIGTGQHQQQLIGARNKKGSKDYSFGLGKRRPKYQKLRRESRMKNQFSFGLGKRAQQYGFGLGKRNGHFYSYILLHRPGIGVGLDQS